MFYVAATEVHVKCNQKMLYFPPHLTSASALPRERGNLETVIMLKIYQVCNSDDCCVQNGSCSSSSMEWKSV